MLIFHKQHDLTDRSLKKLHVIVRCINYLQLNTSHYTTQIRFCTNNLGHWPFVSSFSNTASPTWKFFLLIFYFFVLGDFEGIIFENGAKIAQQYAAICCTCLHCLREYRSGLLNTPEGSIKASLFMVRRFLGDNRISLLMSLRDSTFRGLELMIVSVSVTGDLNPSSLRLRPWVFSNAVRILLALQIWHSQTLPICEAPGGYLYHLIRSVSFCRR